VNGNGRNFMASSRERASGDASTTDRRRASILIVEDEALVASYIQEVLQESGFAIAGIASSGPEAMSLVTTSKPDLALVDIKLAGPMDGIEVAQLLLSHFSVPAIFLSGICDPETMARAKAATPLGFLEKPFRPSQVFNALEQALELIQHQAVASTQRQP
jgi:two-component system, response regulator PdtaR